MCQMEKYKGIKLGGGGCQVRERGRTEVLQINIFLKTFWKSQYLSDPAMNFYSNIF